jgi:hypothetical protein
VLEIQRGILGLLVPIFCSAAISLPGCDGERTLDGLEKTTVLLTQYNPS